MFLRFLVRLARVAAAFAASVRAASGATASTAAARRSALTEATGRPIDARIEIAVHGDQADPLVLGPALADDPAHRMAAAAQRVQVFVARVGVVDQPPFGLEHCGSRLFRRKTVRIGQRLDHLSCDLGRHRRVVERDHPADRELPVFRGRAPVRDPRHPVLVVGDVAAAARASDVGVGDRDPFVGVFSGAASSTLRRRRRGRWRRWRRLRHDGRGRGRRRLRRGDERQHRQREAAENPSEATRHD
jgi:hypothetical protein